MSHNNDMIKLVKLFEGKQEFAGEEIGQKPGDQVRGTDKAETKGTDHPFKGRLVGEDTTLEDVLSKKYQDFKDIQAKKDSGASQEQETEFHKKLDTLVHKTFGKRKNESEQVDEISYPKGYLPAAERSLSQAQATQRQYWRSPEEKAAARRTELNREKGMMGYSKRHRAAHPEMYPKIEPRPAPKLRDPSTEYSDDYTTWARGRRDTMEQGVAEASPETTLNLLKGLKTWQVVIMNNYYRGKYSDYSGRYYYVLATSPEEARQVVLDNADAILQDLLSMKSVNGKKILPRGSAIAITDKRIGDIKDGTEHGRMTTAGFKRMFGPQGPMMVKLSGGAVVDVQGQEQGVAEGSLNEFAPDGFNGGDDDEGFSPEIAKMAQDDGFTKGAGLADGATLERAMAINYWHSQHGGMYKQYFAKGFKAGRMDKIRHNNKQYNLNLKLMKDGSIRHGQQGVAEAIPYALSAANANAEYERTKTFVPRGYKGRVDTEVRDTEEYRLVMLALKKLARAEGQHIEAGLSGTEMSVFSKTMNSEALSDFLDMALQDFDQGVAEGYDKWGWHTSVKNGEFMPTKYGNKAYVYLHDMDNQSANGSPQLVTVNKPTVAKRIAQQFGGKVVKTDLNTYRIVKSAEQGVAEMDKSQTPPGRSGASPDAGKEYTARPVKAKDFAKDASDQWIKNLSKDQLDAIAGPRYKKKGVAEGADNYSPVTNAITRRIMLQRHDLLSKYGVEKVSNAIDEVADFVGDVDEIGSSDVSGWVRHVEQLLSNMGESQINELGATHPAPPQGTATTGAITTTNAAPAAGSISPDEQTALNKINQNPAMKQQLDKLMTQATPGGSSAPMKLDPQEQDALDRVKANAGLGSQYAKLIAQANPAAAKTAAVKP